MIDFSVVIFHFRAVLLGVSSFVLLKSTLLMPISKQWNSAAVCAEMQLLFAADWVKVDVGVAFAIAVRTEVRVGVGVIVSYRALQNSRPRPVTCPN